MSAEHSLVTSLRNIIILLCLAACLSGCARQSARGPVEIVYWTGWSGHEFEIQKKLVDKFNATHPHIHVKILSVFGSYQKVTIAFAGNDTPDVLSAVWADQLAGYAMRRAVTPLDGYMKQSGRSLDEWVPGVRKMLQYKGRTYALAATTNSSFIVYNKDIFREAGVSGFGDSYSPSGEQSPGHERGQQHVGRPKSRNTAEWVPRTIAELDEAAWKCTKYDSNGRFTRYGFRPGWLMVWAYVFGGSWYDPETDTITANHPKNVEALRWMQSYSKRYDIRKMQGFESAFGSMESVNGPFFARKIAMWHTGEWAERFINRYANDINWGWFSLPYPPGGRRNALTVGGSVFVIPTACKHKKEAWKFLNYICGPEAVSAFCHGIGNIPPLTAVIETSRFQRDPLLRFAGELAQSENAFGPPQMVVWPTYVNEITRAEEFAIYGGADPKRLLDKVQKAMERELADAVEGR